MKAATLVTLVVVLTVVWGGFVVCLLRAIRRERNKK